jgi:hypothetical protein
VPPARCHSSPSRAVIRRAVTSASSTCRGSSVGSGSAPPARLPARR